MTISDWLHQLGLETYLQSFSDNDIDMDVLRLLTPEDLSDLGVIKVGHRVRMLKAIAALAPTDTAEKSTTKASDSTLNTHLHAASSNQAERRHLTVMFIDIVGSTELTTQLDPEDVRALYAHFQAIVEKIVKQYDGFIASYMGDGVMCYFGWPTAHEDDAERAVRAALSIIEKATAAPTPNGTELALRVGIATGLVVVGEVIGSGASEEASVAGQTPNLAARMQSIAEPNQVVLPNATRQILNNAFHLDSTGLHTLKGFAEPVEAFVVTGEALSQRRFEQHRRTSLSALVGRGDNLMTIKRAWRRAQRGAGQIVLVTGDAGIGKSRLVQTVIDDTESGDIVRVTLQCSPYRMESALHPVIHELKLAAGHQSSDTAEQRLEKLSKLPAVSSDMLPLLATLLDIDSSAGFKSPDLIPSQLRARTLETLVAMLRRQSQSKPLLIVFEDLHWIDPTSLEFLSLLMNSIADVPVFLLATARPAFTHSFGALNHLHTLLLNHLSQEQVQSLVNQLTDHKALPPEIIKIIIDRTDGVPLFVEELTKTILESNVLAINNNTYRLDGPLDTLAIPATLQDSLMARLDRLQPIKRVAQTASCIGREFSQQLLASILPLDDQELDTAIQSLLSAELVYRTGPPDQKLFQFKHALVRDAAYESLLRSNRRHIHADILGVLEAQVDTPVDLLATHAEAAGLTDKAIDLWETASKITIKRPALDEAISHISHAIRLITPRLESGDTATTDRALSLQIQLGMIVIPRFGWGAPETKQVFERALALSKQVKQSPYRYTIAYGLISSHISRAEYQRAVDDGNAFIELAEQSGESTALILAHRAKCMALMQVAELPRSQHHIDIALSLLDPEKHYGLESKYGIDLGVACSSLSANNLLHMGKTVDADIALTECAAHAQRSGEINSRSFFYAASASFAIVDENDANLERSTRELTLLATKYNLSSWRNWSDVFRGLLLISAGDLDGVELFHQGDQRQVAASQLYRLGASRVSAGHRLHRIGEYAHARQFAKLTEDHVNQTGETSTLPALYSLKAELALTDNDTQTAAGYLTDGITLCRQSCMRLWQLRLATRYAVLAKVHNRYTEARPLLQEAYNAIDDGNCGRDKARAQQILTDPINGHG